MVVDMTQAGMARRQNRARLGLPDYARADEPVTLPPKPPVTPPVVQEPDPAPAPPAKPPRWQSRKLWVTVGGIIASLIVYETTSPHFTGQTELYIIGGLTVAYLIVQGIVDAFEANAAGKKATQ